MEAANTVEEVLLGVDAALEFKLEFWSVTGAGSGVYAAPEQIVGQLEGRVYGHPRFSAGSQVITSKIIAAAGRKVTTKSGSIYILGTMNPKYRIWLKSNNLECNEFAPLGHHPFKTPPEDS